MPDLERTASRGSVGLVPRPEKDIAMRYMTLSLLVEGADLFSVGLCSTMLTRKTRHPMKRFSLRRQGCGRRRLSHQLGVERVSTLLTSGEYVDRVV